VDIRSNYSKTPLLRPPFVPSKGGLNSRVVLIHVCIVLYYQAFTIRIVTLYYIKASYKSIYGLVLNAN